MRLFPSIGDDLLDTAALPSTEQTELNYRTRPFSPDQELRLTLLVLLVPAPVVLSLAAVSNWLIGLHIVFEWLFLAAAIVLAMWLAVRRLIGARFRYDLAAGLLLSTAYLTGKVWSWTDQSQAWTCRVGLLLAWIAACLVARQVCAWHLAGPRVDHETMARWRVNLPGILPHGLSWDCPELLTYFVSPFFIGPAWWTAAWLATDVVGHFWLWPVLFVGTLSLFWLVWHAIAFMLVPWPGLKRSWSATWQAVITFTTYNAHNTSAAGVFRFPTRWLQLVAHRWLLLVSIVLLLALICSSALPVPADSFRQNGTFVGQLFLNLLLLTTLPSIVFLTILWSTAGTLLARFQLELQSCSASEMTEWDNYVDRIINSTDALEREHLLAGTSLVGDYPILVHREIHDQHMHILGDTGASKTSLGIAPVATQLIARADSTVVIVDLKGDRALFETCRLEAARTRKLRFRWVCNEVGKTTFGFNSFLQSHNASLSTEQFVQELLQGLSLDYGLKYGAGYFTAMNEIVLTNVLKNRPARSFRELDKHLRDESSYKNIGHKGDWAQARHLAALVSRLASTEAVNVVPEMYPDQPEVHAEAIDATNLFEEPQVVYLSLRSAIEPTNAPTIARLFLWAMFTAAGHRGSGGHRVYFFLDEFQQVLSDGIKLVFEQFRDLGGTIIAAHQTAGQLNRQGTDLSETIDSCTAVKQVYRASDLYSLDRLEKLAGTQLAKTPMWMQPRELPSGDLVDWYDELHAKDGLLKVRHEERPRLDRNRLLEISSTRQASLLRFTFGSGYTQFAGATVPIISQYPITFDEYQLRRGKPWPSAPGAFPVPPAPARPPAASRGADSREAKQTDFPDQLEQRIQQRKQQQVNQPA